MHARRQRADLAELTRRSRRDHSGDLELTAEISPSSLRARVVVVGSQEDNELEWINCLHQLKNLRKLSLRSNKLRSLPNEMGILKSLQDFVLQDNRLTRLPNNIGGLRGIQRLDLKVRPAALRRRGMPC